jgi:DNA mismatch repair protein MutS
LLPSTRNVRIPAMKLTPMLEQYLRVKSAHPDALLFFRLGDFYEMFFEDAERAAPILDVALTTRSKKDDVPIPMCGVPYHSVQPYIARLLAAGLKVAICDQMEDPATARGLVDRAVVRVVTPGTVTEEECLDPKTPNYLVAVTRETEQLGAGDREDVARESRLAPARHSDPTPVLSPVEGGGGRAGPSARGPASVVVAAVDLSTGELRIAPLADTVALADELARLAPREVLALAGDAALAAAVRSALPEVLLNALPAERFDGQRARQWLDSHGGAAGDTAVVGLRGVGALLWYLGETHRAGLEHLRLPEVHGHGERLQLDQATRRNLELLATMRGERRGSLLWVLDQTMTPMGGRLLRQWLLAPLTDIAAIGERLDAVELLRERHSWRQSLEAELRAIGDLERLGGRLAAGRVTPRDLTGLAVTLERIGRLKQALAEVPASALRRCGIELDEMRDVAARIAATLADDPPLNPRAGGVIRGGYDATVDELRGLSHSGKQYISQLETNERQRSGIASLKVRYNNVFGYYIEVTKPNLHLVPPDYRRKQTTANAERFITPQLEEYEAKVVGAEERVTALEYELFTTLVGTVAAQQARLSRSAAAVAHLDVLCGLAIAAERHQYARPQLSRARRVVIRDGRHPVVEIMAGRNGFVPNDCILDPDGPQILTITGPNMAGKSTYLRQVALIVLMAQMGSCVPAAAAEIGIADRLFTRVGASDNLAGGESTFMVEMKETADILAHLTPRSLVILDEIGRGTSTFDGISIAWAVAEHLHAAAARPLVLFATHYHELTDLARTHERIENRSVAVREWKGDVVFLRRIVEGPASQSYGIQVARLAGVPTPVIERAKQILRNLEQGELNEAGQPRLAQGNGAAAGQLALFGQREPLLRDALLRVDVDRLTPLDALTRLHALVELARKDSES